MIIYHFTDNEYYDESNQLQHFFTGKTAAEKARRQHVRQRLDDKTERDWWLNEHPIKSFELKGKAMIVQLLNEAAAEGFVSSIENVEEI
jgi:hypothetical protein